MSESKLIKEAREIAKMLAEIPKEERIEIKGVIKGVKMELERQAMKKPA